MWISDTKAYGSGLQNIKYTYALLCVVEDCPHDVDTCTFNTCHRRCNPQPLKWNCEWETFIAPSHWSRCDQGTQNSHHKGIKRQLPRKPCQTYVVLCNLRWHARTTTTTMTSLIWAIKIVAHHLHTIVHWAAFYFYLFIILVDKL